MVNYPGKNSILFYLIMTLCSCEQERTGLLIDMNSESTFSGTFETLNSDNVSGEVTLHIDRGTYVSSTNLPHGLGAGELIIEKQSIHFRDTLFFPVPAIYGPSYVLSGEYQYRFDGNTLTIWKDKNVGEINYRLRLEH